MTEAQYTVALELLRGPLTGKQLAAKTRCQRHTTFRALDAMFRRSWVTLDGLGRYAISERGIAATTKHERLLSSA